MLASRDKDLCQVQTRPTWFEPAAGYRSLLVALNLPNELLPLGQCHGQGTPLLTGWLFYFQICHNGLVSIRNEQVCLYRWIARGGSWYTDERFLSICPLNHSQTRHWVKVDYNIMLHWLHVPIIVQCQSDGHSLSSNDGAVIREYLGQAVASYLTILETTVGDCCCPRSLVYLRSVCIDFIM